MRVILTLEQRFDRTPDGVVWTSGPYAYSFWKRYLDVFDSVCVVARVRTVASIPTGYAQASGINVNFLDVPYYHGPQQFLRVAPSVMRTVQASFKANDAVILRSGLTLATVMHPALVRMGHPYGVEVVGDPYEVFAPGAVQYMLRPVLRSWFTWAQKRQCAGACGAAYVTKRALQERYPCRAFEVGISDVQLDDTQAIINNGTFATHYSSIELTSTDFNHDERSFSPDTHRVQLIFVGSLEQLYKAPDILIKAVAKCVHDGINLGLVMVGEGIHSSSLKSLVAQLNLTNRVRFAGSLPAGQAVRDRLDASDLFVLPSRTEGLPRAMIEAMARGLPCIGSTIGGIPELLPSEDMVPPGEVDALAQKIREVVTNPERMRQMSQRNLETAKEYCESILRVRRNEYYGWIKRKTEEWLHSKLSMSLGLTKQR